MNIKELLEKIKSEAIPLEEAEKILKKLPYEDIDFAKIDHHRRIRSGYGEVVYCESKTVEQIAAIFSHIAEQEENILGTRASQEQFEFLRKQIAKVEYNPLSRILKVIRKPVEQKGLIAVCTAGTADIPVAEEAAETAEFFGNKVFRCFDVGVAGIHRLLNYVDKLNEANCIIAVAGMEGALGSVLAGLVNKPVVAVPTSVGYGANFGGVSALLTMINSCANGISVVNIDNGYGAAYVASQINRMVVEASE